MAAFGLGLLGSFAFAETARFSGGAEVTLPPNFASASEDGGKTLVVFPKDARTFELRLTFHSLVPHLKEHPKAAEEFIAKRASDQKLELVRIPGTNYVGYIQYGAPKMEANGVRTRSLHTDFAIPQGILVSTLTLPTDKMTDPAVKAFLRGPMEKILASVRYSGS